MVVDVLADRSAVTTARRFRITPNVAVISRDRAGLYAEAAREGAHRGRGRLLTAYWLMWGLRVSMPKRSMWRVAQFDTLRLRLIKIAARVVEMKTMIRVHLPTSCPAQDILRFALGRIPRLVTWQTGHEAPNIHRRSFQPSEPSSP